MAPEILISLYVGLISKQIKFKNTIQKIQGENTWLNPSTCHLCLTRTLVNEAQHVSEQTFEPLWTSPFKQRQQQCKTQSSYNQVWQ